MSRCLSKRGGISVFLCLVLSAVILFVGTLAQAAQIRAAEHAVVRGLDALISSTLANYERKLLELGLFAFSADGVDSDVFSSTLPLSLRNLESIIVPISPLGQPDVLDHQIIRHMKARLPAVYARMLLTRITDNRNGLLVPFNQALQTTSALPAEQKPDLVGKIIVDMSGRKGFSDLFRQIFDDLSSKELRQAVGHVFGEGAEDLGNRIITQVEQTYRQYAVEYAGCKNSDTIDSAVGKSGWLDPVTLTRLGDTLDQIFKFNTVPVYEKLCLIEYVTGYFRSGVDYMDQKAIKTLTGKVFHSFPTDRQFEVEQILTGKDNPRSAGSAAKTLLTGLRIAIHLLRILTDSKLYQEIRSIASAISASLLVLSSGAAVIDSNLILILLIMGKAISGGMSDYAELAAGRSVAIWPDKSSTNVDLYYLDYLRLMLLLIPRTTLLERISRLINRMFPEISYTGLKVSTEFRNKEYQLCGSYQ